MNLSQEQLRVLGVLIEKKYTTPEQFPLTLNSIRVACNQKTSRAPVVNYEESLVRQTIAELLSLGLARKSAESTARATRYDHNLEAKLLIGQKELAVLCVLMLRGPQTLGEIRSRSQRIYAFSTTEDVEELLSRMERREPRLAELIQKRPGEKESRYRQLLGCLDETLEEIKEKPPILEHEEDTPSLDAKLTELEERIVRLEQMVFSE